MLVAGIGRTETFDLQKRGQLKQLPNSAHKAWFLLEDVLIYVSQHHGLPLPDQKSIETHAKLIVEMRQKKAA